MQVGAGTDGIQQLLAAEAEAQRIVADARKAKQDRLKQAKQEAERELSAFRAEREQAYTRKVNEGTSSSGAHTNRLTQDAQQAVQKVQQDVAKAKGEVVDMLFNYVTRVQLKAD